MADARSTPIPSWRPGRYLSSEGRTRLVALAGFGSQTGVAERRLALLMRFLAQQGGYHPRHDLLEASYGGSYDGARWLPRSYGPDDTRRPLFDSAEAVAGALEWYRDALPPATRFCFVGYSLGGVVGLDGATLALARDRDGWRGRLAAVITLASPLRGCNVGSLLSWVWLARPDLEGLGPAGTDLDRRWRDPQERARVERRVEFLRASGVTVLTLADPDDAVVRPEEALLPAPGESAADLLVRTDRVVHGTHGHGAIVEEPAVWQRILHALGPQEQQPRPTGGRHQAGQASPPPPPADPVEQELQAIKARLRAQGRL